MRQARLHQPRGRRSPGRMRRLLSGAMLLPIFLVLGACDEIIQVDAPSRVIATALEDPSNAALLTNSVGADFECALAHYVVAGGLVGNELEISTTLIVMKEYDKRDFKPFGSVYATATCDATFSVGVYKPLSTARWQGDNTLELLQGWTDEEVEDRQQKIATVAAYSGYSHVLMGEAMCTAAFDLGPELQPTEIFQRADQRFSTAISAAQSAGREDIINWASVGRARALHRLGRTSEAADVARQVPTDFVKHASYGTESARRENAVWDRNVRDQGFTIDPTFRDKEFDGVDDPRVRVEDTGLSASDGETPLFVQTKYPDGSSGIPIATWEEAQLIIAEAELDAGNTGTAVDIINILHTRAGLPAFGGGDADAVREHLLEERQRELFLESHHLGDLRQYDLPLIPAPGVPFKDGGGVYEDQRCFPLPDVERLNNPDVT